MVSLARMEDAAFPPQNLAPGVVAVAGYIGGDTVHVWTKQEWHRFDQHKLPVFVRSNHGDGAKDGWAALEKLFELNVTKGSVVVYDIETQTAPEMVHAFGQIVNWGGYRVWTYGSLGNLFANPFVDGYWVADYTGIPHMVAHPEVKATQYEDGGSADMSEINDWQVSHRLLWR